MILKLFPSWLLHPSSPVLQDRTSLPFQVLQALICPKIVFWLLLMPLGIPRNQVGSCCVHLLARPACQERIKAGHQRPGEPW